MIAVSNSTPLIALSKINRLNLLKEYFHEVYIREQKRLCRVHRAMKGFGDPVHYSVFRCHLTPKGRVEMVAALTELINQDEDRIMIIDMGPVDGRVEERIEFLGAHPQEIEAERKFIIV